MKKILVTGGAGFIGSHLCLKLHGAGHHVICLDNLYSGSLRNVFELQGQERFEWIEQSVTEEIHLAVDEIYHLACPASPVHYQKDPLYTLDTNYIGAKQVLALAKKNNATVVLASTSEVYGDPLVHPQVETYLGNVNPIGVRACYDEGKRISETLFFDHHRAHGTKIKVARIFNTYGPLMNQADGRVVSNFITQALKGVDITVYGKGNQTRSFCYVDDMVDGLMALMNSSMDITGPVNLGNPVEQQVIEVASTIIKATQSSSSIQHHPLPDDDPKLRQPDITLAKTLLGWSPKVPFDQGLKKTIDYFRGFL